MGTLYYTTRREIFRARYTAEAFYFKHPKPHFWWSINVSGSADKMCVSPGSIKISWILFQFNSKSVPTKVVILILHEISFVQQPYMSFMIY